MVSVKNFEGDCPLLKQTSGSEQSKCSQASFRGNLCGITAPVYHFGTPPAQDNGFYGGLPCTAEKGQSLLDSLLLSQWEDRAWRGLLTYDVTSCETKVISGCKKFVAQLNKNWNLNFSTELDNEMVQPLESSKFSYMKTHREDLLFCVASGDKDSSELIPSTKVPNNIILVIINANPVEYGHIFLVPYSSHHPPCFLDNRSLELITQVAVEINNSSFRIFYDHTASSNSFHVYFQACYFANTLPVEGMPVVSIFGNLLGKGINICEVAEYPIKTLVFMGKKDLKVLVEVVSEICSCLRDQSTPFNLLISDCGAKIFLFPLVKTLGACVNLSAWECGGHFVFKTLDDFELATEQDILKHMVAFSLDDRGFQSIKNLCCNIASKIIS